MMHKISVSISMSIKLSGTPIKKHGAQDINYTVRKRMLTLK